MAFSYNVNSVVDDYLGSSGKTNFEDSLKFILKRAKKDPRIKKVSHLAYLLATAKVESDYSVERWEGDYLCGSIGHKYKDKPCPRALAYYASDVGKKDYFPLGIDSKGLPYFGRGLIQLTGKYNYENIGRKIGKGDALVNNPELVFDPDTSYDIAVEILNQKKAGKSVFDHVDKGNFTKARKWVNGGTNKLSEVNRLYNKWLDILEKNDAKVINRAPVLKTAGISTVIISLALFSVGVWYFRNK